MDEKRFSNKKKGSDPPPDTLVGDIEEEVAVLGKG